MMWPICLQATQLLSSCKRDLPQITAASRVLPIFGRPTLTTCGLSARCALYWKIPRHRRSPTPSRRRPAHSG